MTAFGLRHYAGGSCLAFESFLQGVTFFLLRDSAAMRESRVRPSLDVHLKPYTSQAKMINVWHHEACDVKAGLVTLVWTWRFISQPNSPLMQVL